MAIAVLSALPLLLWQRWFPGSGKAGRERGGGVGERLCACLCVCVSLIPGPPSPPRRSVEGGTAARSRRCRAGPRRALSAVLSAALSAVLTKRLSPEASGDPSPELTEQLSRASPWCSLQVRAATSPEPSRGKTVGRPRLWWGAAPGGVGEGGVADPELPPSRDAVSKKVA